VDSDTGRLDRWEQIEAYYDAAPRTSAQPETVGPFTLFVGHGAWAYYARPTLGTRREIGSDDVRALRERQRELDVPEEIEWQQAVTPSLADACRRAGMAVHHFRLLVHDGSAPIASDAGAVRVVGPTDDLAQLLSVQQQGFGGPADVATGAVEHLAGRLHAGTSRMAAAFSSEDAVCVGIHQPVGEVSEVVGVATLPAHRRRGWAGSVTRALVIDAQALGVRTVFLSAADDAVARVYERVGFRDVGVVCAAEPASSV
jgi:hypothetical protein